MKIRDLKKIIKGNFAKLGIRVASFSVYDRTEDYPGKEIITVGYYPNRCAIFTLYVNVNESDLTTTFDVRGQVNCDGQDVVRAMQEHSFGSTSSVSGKFSVNTNPSFKSKNLLDQIEIGFDWYGKFISIYDEQLKQQSTECIDLWFVPECSKKYRELVEKNGQPT